MGKSKRNRKKQNRQMLPIEAVAPVLESTASRPKNKLWIALVVAVVLIGAFLFFRSPSPAPQVTSTASQPTQPGIPLVQSGSSDSLSPSGSLDLQPTGAPTSAGSVQ